MTALSPTPSPRLGASLLALVLGTLIWSGIQPTERYTWALEIVPVVIGAPLLWLTHRSFPLTRTSILAIATYSVVLLIGGHYTYAAAPPGEWAQATFDLERNPYDRFGHILQGLLPALLARELLQRKTGLAAGGWLVLAATAIGLSVSALYEILEWPATLIASRLTGEAAEGFLETQGDVFDSPKDMLFALIGAILGQVLFARAQDRQLAANAQIAHDSSALPNKKRAA
jgi:putative membrane protein